VSNSILTSTKKLLNIHENDTDFDMDVLLHINSAFSTLHQLGVGPENGFAIVDATDTWTSFLGTDQRFNSVKSYIYLKVRLIFDPPATSFHLEAVNRQIQELEWRLNVLIETDLWTDPDPDGSTPEIPPILDGGTP
jgi:hypothetical protein